VVAGGAGSNLVCPRRKEREISGRISGNWKEPGDLISSPWRLRCGSRELEGERAGMGGLADPVGPGGPDRSGNPKIPLFSIAEMGLLISLI
jgi:hypothetical protein